MTKTVLPSDPPTNSSSSYALATDLLNARLSRQIVSANSHSRQTAATDLSQLMKNGRTKSASASDVQAPISPTGSATSILSSPTSLSSSSRSNILVDLDISLPSSDQRLTLMGVDVSENFYRFQQYVINKLQDETLTIEDQIQHLLSLSSILLIKPGRTHIDLDQFIDVETCEGLRRDFISGIQTSRQRFYLQLSRNLI
ncbi:hypothetical protein DM01DRAFT_1190450 [Hesseltinella vesiculosa]|uniref:Uncharacterized protein n=1 Tax=Hesseltinella vesiculosa TaxID=101127 RepID=A0A1X2GRI2_9FUNG|nr:hypothetical protein DM01DRAFT_1190450 [Hesseltinella vesiculosa]